jgi:hypothetical protein
MQHFKGITSFASKRLSCFLVGSDEKNVVAVFMVPDLIGQSIIFTLWHVIGK